MGDILHHERHAELSTRFFVHRSIAVFADIIAQKHGLPGEQAMLFPSRQAATRCKSFVERHAGPGQIHTVRLLDFIVSPGAATEIAAQVLSFSAIIYPRRHAKLAKTFWQHTGEGVSSRRAEYCKNMYDLGALVERGALDDMQRAWKGPRRYRNQVPIEGKNIRFISKDERDNDDFVRPEHNDHVRFVEERFGRNLSIEMAETAKKVIRRRIAGSLTSDTDLERAARLPPELNTIRQIPDFSDTDVYLYPGGMNSIYHTHRTLLLALNPGRRTICFGFPYIDTLKVLEQFGPGCLFYGHGSSADLDDLERRLIGGERFNACFAEFPTNPLLRSPDLRRLRHLATHYDFALVVDETIGNFLNISILPTVDVLVSSLTKVFSGDSNVMGGAAVLNPRGQYYTRLKRAWTIEYEDTYWPEDAIVMERNSRDFVSRIARINANAAAIAHTLAQHPQRIKAVLYPATSPTRHLYDAFRTPSGGYGGLLSVTFYDEASAARFYDALEIAKGPSLGTNFTLASPFVVLAHWGELEWARSYGVPKELVRFSVGLEETGYLVEVFERAVRAM